MLQAHAVWRMDGLDQNDQWQASPTAVSQLRASISLTSSAGAADSVVRSRLATPRSLECLLRLTCGLQQYTDGGAPGVLLRSHRRVRVAPTIARGRKSRILNFVGSHVTTGRPRPAPTRNRTERKARPASTGSSIQLPGPQTWRQVRVPVNRHASWERGI